MERNIIEGRTWNPIKVMVTLRRSQFTGEDNKWVCTINGEKRVVTLRDVQWFCESMEEAISSFNEEEIESYNIMRNLNIIRPFM